MNKPAQGSLFEPRSDASIDDIAARLRAMTYPNAPGFKENTTSREAAAKVHEPDQIRARVFDAIERKPSTADEVAKALDLDKLTVRPRVTELNKTHKIERDGNNRRRNDSGRMAIVWRKKVQHG